MRALSVDGRHGGCHHADRPEMQAPGHGRPARVEAERVARPNDAVFAVFGLGEAGSRIAADLVSSGAAVHGYDPASVPTPPGGIRRHDHPADAVERADVVLAVTAAADAEEALRQALDRIPGDALYADLSTSSPEQERALAEIAAARRLLFADVALMSTVVGKGVRTPQLASGPGADRYAGALVPRGAPVTIVGEEAGQAASRKLLRSILVKGLTGVAIEALRAGAAAGLEGWLWGEMVREITAVDEQVLVRLISGTVPHARRRLAEMEAAADLLEELGIDPVMTRGTVNSLRQALNDGVPDPPTVI